MRYTDPKSWASLMGCDLAKSDLQPLEPMDDGAAVRIGGNGEDRTLPLAIEEHSADILGPRFVDELRADCVVRHSIPGPPRDGWDAGRIHRLEHLLCSEPFRVDPISAIGECDDWVAWMTRNRVLDRPAPMIRPSEWGSSTRSSAIRILTGRGERFRPPLSPSSIYWPWARSHRTCVFVREQSGFSAGPSRHPDRPSIG